MNGPTTPIVEVARKLSEAQRTAIENAFVGKTIRGTFPPICTHIVTLHSLYELGLCGRAIGYPLTKRGLAVRAHLLTTQEEKSSD